MHRLLFFSFLIMPSDRYTFHHVPYGVWVAREDDVEAFALDSLAPANSS